MSVQHFLSLADLDSAQLHALLDRAAMLKRELRAGEFSPRHSGRTLAMLFGMPSTRTRLSFETAMHHLGGHAIFLSSDEAQLSRGETVEDTARVLSRMVDAVVIRIPSHQFMQRFAECSRVPVINGLSDAGHPCQVLADVLTYIEHRGSIQGRQVAWIGAGSNVCRSYIEAASRFDFQLRLACPEFCRPPSELLRAAADHVQLFTAPGEAVRGASLVVTDVWTSMGEEPQRERRRKALGPFQVNEALMRLARRDALFMHCLPAHRGEEVSAELIDAPGSVVWDEAENRLHAQKALLEFLLPGSGGAAS